MFQLNKDDDTIIFNIAPPVLMNLNITSFQSDFNFLSHTQLTKQKHLVFQDENALYK